MADIVRIKTFVNRVEAEFAVSVLEAAGIRAIISADDAGGMRPDVGLSTGGVSLFVNREDAEDALSVLEAPSED